VPRCWKKKGRDLAAKEKGETLLAGLICDVSSLKKGRIGRNDADNGKKE